MYLWLHFQMYMCKSVQCTLARYRATRNDRQCEKRIICGNNNNNKRYNSKPNLDNLMNLKNKCKWIAIKMASNATGRRKVENFRKEIAATERNQNRTWYSLKWRSIVMNCYEIIFREIVEMSNRNCYPEIRRQLAFYFSVHTALSLSLMPSSKFRWNEQK